MPDLITLCEPPQLPFECEVEAIVPDNRRGWYIITSRETGNKDRFAVHRYDPLTGACHHGSYVESIEIALKKLFQRAGISN